MPETTETKVSEPTEKVSGPTGPTVRRGIRKERVGEVISNKMDKTIVVEVQRRFPHPKFKKIVTAYKKFYAHDEKNEAGVGDRVRIVETRPLSKSKRWRLLEIVERAESAPAPAPPAN